VWEPARAAAESAKKNWETAAANDEANADELYEVYAEAEAEFRKLSFELNEKLELIDRIRFWYSITKLGR